MVLLGACLIGGAMADGWAHVNIIDTLEGFFTPWHGLLYAGFAGSAGWTFWVAFQRRDRAPYWWRDGWPTGYRVGAIGVLVFFVGGFADMVWHETIGVEAGLNATFSPSHMLIDAGAVLIVTSPLRSWWASSTDGRRAVTGVASATLGAMAATILLSHSSAFRTWAPLQGYDPDLAELATDSSLAAIAGVDSYLVTTVLLAAPLLWIHRRRPVAGAATALTFGVALFILVMFEFPRAQTAGALGALCGAVLVDVLLVRLDRSRGRSAALRLPLAGALFAGLVWAGHLLGLQVAAQVRWPAEMITGVPALAAVLGAVLGGLAASPGSPPPPDPADAAQPPAAAEAA